MVDPAPASNLPADLVRYSADDIIDAFHTLDWQDHDVALLIATLEETHIDGCTPACSEHHTFEPPCEQAVVTDGFKPCGCRIGTTDRDCPDCNDGEVIR